MIRKKIPPTVQADVIIKSRRRCALCVGIDGNLSECSGQIAHLNGKNTDNRFENLVWLCLNHHDRFDSTTSQTKNYTPIEVRTYRDKLYQSYTNSEFNEIDIEVTRNYLNEYSLIFTYLFDEYGEIANAINSNIMQSLADIRDYWHTSNLRSFNSDIQEIQDHIANNITGLLSIFEINMYDSIGHFILFNKQNFSREILNNKQQEARNYIDAIAGYYKNLQRIATK